MRMIRNVLPLSAFLIVTLLSGCDNVEWGGIQVAIVRPAPPDGEPETAASAGDETLPEGHVLYYVQADASGTRAVIRPVAEIGQGTLHPLRPIDPERYAARFITRFFPQGSRFTLFRHGRDVGSLTVDATDLAGPGMCRELPVARGRVNVPAGERAGEYLALARGLPSETRDIPPRQPELDRRMRILAPVLAEALLESRGARLPQSWTDATAQLEAFPVPGTADGAFAATFLVDDTLGPGLDAAGSSLFFVAVPEAQVGYDTVFVRYADYSARGKGAPRLIDYLDWDNDGRPDLLLQVYDTAQSWFEAVGGRDGRWRLTLRDRCDPPPLAVDSIATRAPQPVTTPAPAPVRRRATPRPQPEATLPDIPEPRVRVAGQRDTVPPPDTGGVRIP